jgi:hypothetical protein
MGGAIGIVAGVGIIATSMIFNHRYQGPKWALLSLSVVIPACAAMTLCLGRSIRSDLEVAGQALDLPIAVAGGIEAAAAAVFLGGVCGLLVDSGAAGAGFGQGAFGGRGQ